jgi:hypothetical protein
LELSISKITGSGKKFINAKGMQFKEFIKVLVKSKATYNELFKSGEIQSTAVGEKVIIDIKSNLCGDILIFIRSKENSAFAGQDVMRLILTDNKIVQQKEIALNLLKQKHEGLIAAPGFISLLINMLFILLSVIFTFRSIEAIIQGNNALENARDLWPWIFPAITFIFRKSIGTRLISLLFRFF